jgi:hypothetical protein
MRNLDFGRVTGASDKLYQFIYKWDKPIVVITPMRALTSIKEGTI